VTDHWLDEPSPYLARDAPRCRRHPSELGTNCRSCRSEAIADHDSEPENIQTLADVIPFKSRRS
jgi:hypothetical protein